MVSAGDKRLFQRFSARFPARVKDSRQDFGSDIFLQDASAQGMRLTSRERFLLNDRLSVEVKLPDSQNPVTLSGRVIWSKSEAPNLWDVGLQFHQVQLLKLSRLYQFSID